MKDLELDLGNANIKYQSQLQSNAALTENNTRLQNQLNEKLVQIENMNRENSTLKETFKQLEIQKREYIQKVNEEMEKMKFKYE